MSMTTEARASLGRLRNGAILVGIGGGIASYFIAKANPDEFFPAYLVSYLFWIGISLGSLAISMLHHVTGGGWGIPIRRTIESAASALLLMGVLILPITFEMGHLYSWADAALVASDDILQRKAHYLNKDSFFLRAGIYFAVWIVLTWISNWATATDGEGQVRRQRRLSQLGGFGLMLWGLSVTFAAVDWAMSLEPHWYSSMYGVLFMAGQVVAALSFAVVIGVLFGSGLPQVLGSDSAEHSIATSRLHDLGNLMLAMVMFWSYVSFMQFLIIWSANLPEETPWYLRRGQGGWQVVVMVLAALHFVVPILLLLMRQTKRNAPRLLRLALLLLLMRVVDLAWLVLPTFTPNLSMLSHAETIHDEHGVVASSGTELWPLLITFPTIGGLWLAYVAWRLAARSKYPVYDPSLLQEQRDELARHAAT